MSEYQHQLGALRDAILWALVLGVVGIGWLTLFLSGVAAIAVLTWWLWVQFLR